MRRPLLGMAASFGLGCLLHDGQATLVGALTLVALAALATLLALAAGPGRHAVAAIAAASLALGNAAAVVETLKLEASSLRIALREGRMGGRPQLLMGALRGDAELRDGSFGFLLDTEAEGVPPRLAPIQGRVRIEVGGELPKPRLLDADRVAVWTTLRAAERIESGVAAFGYCKSARLVEKREPTGAHSVRRAAAAARERARAVFARAMPPGTERGLVRAMVLGDRSEIDPETEEAFKASGTYHVLALSGAQVALVAALLVAGLRYVVLGPWVEAAVATTAVAAYAGFVGADVPVTRAALMAAALLVGRALELDADARNLLGFAAIVLLAWSPGSAGDAGLQLSFAATLGILALVGPLARGAPRLPLRLELVLAASVAAQCALVPLLAGHFHRLAPAAVALNLAAVPLASTVLLAGFAVLAFEPIGLGAAAGSLAWIAARALRVSGDLGPLAPWLDVRVPSPGPAVLTLYLVGIAWLLRGRRGRGLLAIAAAHAALVFGPLSPAADGRLHLEVVDVGQGDALLLRSRSGRVIVVDAGGSRDGRFDPGERRVAPEIWRYGVRRLDALVASHGHPDHVGGMPFLLRAFRVDAAWEGPAAPRDLWRRRLDDALDRARATRLALVRGAGRDWDGARLRVLGPAAPRTTPIRVRNEDSLVIEVVYGAVRLLLTGDTTAEAEAALRASAVDVLKVPHHGSRTSSSAPFVAAARPRLAVVSAGARNPFGHPHSEILGRYTRAGSLVLRTDRDGSVRIATDGSRVWVRTSGEGHERRIR